MYLIVGLGNPGAEYQNTRHNLGFRVIDRILSDLSIPELKRKKKCDAYVAESIYDSRKIILAQPQTYMNSSGSSVSVLLNWYKIPPEHLILIYDDVDLDIGQVRAKKGGGAAGHHGVESVINSTGSSDFLRVRVGIGRESLSGDVSSYVLQKIPPEQIDTLLSAVEKAAQTALAIILADGRPYKNSA